MAFGDMQQSVRGESCSFPFYNKERQRKAISSKKKKNLSLELKYTFVFHNKDTSKNSGTISFWYLCTKIIFSYRNLFLFTKENG